MSLIPQLHLKMKKEQYQKLKQLDRIEYLLLKKEVEWNPITFSFIWDMIWIGMFCAIFTLLMFGFYKNIIGFKWALVIIIVVDVLSFLYYLKKKLEKYIFNFKNQEDLKWVK